MDSEFIKKLLKEIARKCDVIASLEFLIEIYNTEYKDLNATEEDFSIRLAKTPEEACYITTIITIPKSEISLDEDTVRTKADYYDKLITKALKSKCKYINPNYVRKLSWESLEKLMEEY